MICAKMEIERSFWQYTGAIVFGSGTSPPFLYVGFVSPFPKLITKRVWSYDETGIVCWTLYSTKYEYIGTNFNSQTYGVEHQTAPEKSQADHDTD